MRKVAGLAVVVLLAAGCTSGAAPVKKVAPTPTTQIPAPYEATSPDGFPLMPGSHCPCAPNPLDTTTTAPRPVVILPATTTTNPALLANVNYWRSHLSQDEGAEERQRTLVTQDEGSSEESGDLQTLERDEEQVAQDQQNLAQAESRYQNL